MIDCPLTRWSVTDWFVKPRSLASPSSTVSVTRARASTLLYRTFLAREFLPIAAGRYRKQRLTVPTLVMHGGEEPKSVQRLYRGGEENADDLEVVTIPGGDHFLPEERPEEVSRAILDFFAQESS